MAWFSSGWGWAAADRTWHGYSRLDEGADRQDSPRRSSADSSLTWSRRHAWPLHNTKQQQHHTAPGPVSTLPAHLHLQFALSRGERRRPPTHSTQHQLPAANPDRTVTGAGLSSFLLLLLLGGSGTSGMAPTAAADGWGSQGCRPRPGDPGTQGHTPWDTAQA